MKKLLLALMGAFVSLSTISATEVTVQTNSSNFEPSGSEYVYSKDGLTITFGDPANASAMQSGHFRLYGGKTVTFASTAGNISKITFTADGNYAFNLGATTGTFNSSTNTWTGDAATVTFTNNNSAQTRIGSVTVTYGEGGGTTEPEPDPTPGEGGETITEELTVKSFTSSSSTSYTTYTFESSLTGITYSAMMATNSGKSIQLRTTNSNEGLVTTANPNGLTLKSVTIEYNSSTNNARISDLYGKDGNYTSPANLFTTNDAGTKFGSIPMTNPATVNTNAGYTGFGVRSNNNALFIDKLILVWEKQSGGLQLPEISFPQNNYTVALGEDFTSPVATAKSNGKITYSSSKTAVASVNETTGVLEIKAVGSTTITATIAATDTYKEGSAQYILTVTPNGIITVDQALAYIEDGYNGEATVKGYITRIDEVSPSYGNATYYIADEKGGSPELEVYRGNWMNGEKFTAEDQIEVDGLITVQGTLVNFNGTYEFTTGSQVIAYEAPEIPEDQVAAPTFDPNGGTIAKDSQITISCETEGATIVYTINDGEIEETLAPVTLTISEDTEIVAYATKEGMTESKTITVNYTVFDENQTVAEFDFTNEAWLEGEGLTIPTLDENGTNVAGKSFTNGAITISFPENSASNKARIWLQTGGDVQLRVFAGDNFTISAAQSYCITKITFATAGSTYTKFAPEEGTPGDWKISGTTSTWTSSQVAPAALDVNGNVTSVTFVPESASRINSITVDYELSTGIDGIEAEDAAPVYYNLQGVRVANPEKGLYIVVKGNKAEKVIF